MILSLNLNCLYARPGDWTRVAAVLDEAANHYTNGAGTCQPDSRFQGLGFKSYCQVLLCTGSVLTAVPGGMKKADLWM